MVYSITNNDGRSLDLNFDFFKEGKDCVATIYKDDPEVKTKTNVTLENKVLNKISEVELNLKASGGVAIWIREKD